jgi:hypothetical protein
MKEIGYAELFILVIPQRLQRLGLALAMLFLLIAPAAAKQANEAQRNAIRQACPADDQTYCANDVPAAGEAAFACLKRNLASLSPACQSAVKAVSTGAAHRGLSSSTSAAPAASQSPQAVRSQPASPMSPREELMVLRQSCGGDFRALFSGIPLGGGRAIACLRAHAGSLSPQCGEALSAAHGSR